MRFSAGCWRSSAESARKLKGRIDAIKYSAAGFSDMWILVQTRRRGAKRRARHRPHRLALHGPAGEDDRRPARQRRDRD